MRELHVESPPGVSFVVPCVGDVRAQFMPERRLCPVRVADAADLPPIVFWCPPVQRRMSTHAGCDNMSSPPPIPK
jgi:hypothetical protein